MIFVIYGLCMACWLAALLKATPAWVRALNRGGAELGSAVAWFCSGGLGWQIAQIQLERVWLDSMLADYLASIPGSSHKPGHHG